MSLWIEFHTNLPTHPKTRRLARMLGTTIPATIGHLGMLWTWAAEYADDGDISQFEPVDIAEVAEWEGDPDQFIDALIECGPGNKLGFLDRTADGGLRIHDWEQYIGKLLERRRKDAERKREAYRAGIQRNSDGDPAEDDETSGGDPEDRVRNRPTEPTDQTNLPSSDESEEMRLARLLDSRIHDNNVRARKTTAATLRRWADSARRMVERDNRTIEEIEKVMRWSQDDPFWRTNILSMEKLRNQFDQLSIKMESAPKQPVQPERVIPVWMRPEYDHRAVKYDHFGRNGGLGG